MQDAPVRFPSVQWLFQCDDHFAAREAFEVRQFFQRTVETRRRYFKTLVIDVFDRQYVLQLTGNFFAVFDPDAGGLVDIHAQHAAPGALEINELVAEAHDRGFNQFRQLHSALRCSRCKPSRYTRELRAKPAHVRATRDADPHKLSGKKWAKRPSSYCRWSHLSRT